ncbi:MAG: N-acetylmuramoyl-L-alanine amidase, partial [Bacteroidetes bacterium]|nr:N-acetylmuramoyl-L-alanine amidase [Bacteroidota bacterium]
IFTFLNNKEYQLSYSFPEYTINLVNVFGEANYKILSSPHVTISEESIIDQNGNQYQKSLNAPPPPTIQSTDFGPAIWNPTTCNYSSRGGTAVSAITIHTVQGSYAGCISWFKNCNASVSAHYVARSSDGQITQMVRENQKGWHVGNHNPYTIGIEHEGYINNSSWYTVAMYTGSGNLSKDITQSGYGILPTSCYNGPSCNGGSGSCQLANAIRIKGHQHYSSQSHTDPGINWNWPYYYCIINNCSNPTPPPPAPTITSSNTCGDKTITRASPPSGTTYYWQGTSCGTSVANSALNYTVSSSGTYYLRAKNSNGWSTCSSIIVTINDIPNDPPAPTTTTNSCGSQTLTRGTPPSGVTFYWQSTSCGTSITSSALTYTAPSTGTYKLRARQNAGSCWSNNCSSVAVTVAPTPATPPVPTSSTNSCGSVTLTMPNAPSGETYYWQGSSCGVNTTDASSTYIVTASGTYYLRSLNSQGCWSSCRSLAVSIIDCPENLIVSFGPCSASMVYFIWINSNVNWTLQVSLDSAFSSFYTKPASNVTLLSGPTGFTPSLNFQSNATYYWRILTGTVYTYGPNFILPFCDVIPPTTVIAPVTGWQSTNFTANFTDSDNSGGSGLGKSFYRVLDFDGTEWRANGSRGFANDNFDNTILNPDWTNHTGTWANASGFLEQSDDTEGNSNISAPLTQNLSNRYLYHWNAKIDGSGINRKAGLHFFSDSASLPNRGNSYLVWFSMDEHKLEFYKVTNDLMTLVKSRNYSFVAGQFYDFKLVYDRINGKMDIYINNIIAESWADAAPIASGNSISFRTADANMTINYFKTF